MVIRADPLCSWHYMLGDANVPAKAFKVSLDGVGGYYDLCEECDSALLGPFRAMHAAKLVRAVRIEPLPEGWVASAAWPDAPSSAAQPGALLDRGKRLAINGAPVGKRVNNGGARKNPGPLPKSRNFLCPVAWCKHEGFGSLPGVTEHVQRHHPGLELKHLMRQVKECGLCPEPDRKVRNTQWMGQHVAAVHPELVPPSTGTGTKIKGHALLLVSTVRRSGDPHGTLKGMDEYALSVKSAETPEPQPAQGISVDDQADDQLFVAR